MNAKPSHPPLVILCVDDESPVLEALTRDLAPFEEQFQVEIAGSAAEAREVIGERESAGARIALVLCDHLMPGTSGTDFLIELEARESTRGTAKVLVTAQAGLEDTVRAVNEAGLAHYFAKPWKAPDLHAVVRRLLTDYVVKSGLDPMPYMMGLDAKRVAEALRRRNPYTDT